MVPLTKYGNHISPLEQARRTFVERYQQQRTTTYRKKGVIGAALSALKQAKRQYRYAQSVKAPNAALRGAEGVPLESRVMQED